MPALRRIALLIALHSTGAQAQEHEHALARAEKLGSAHLATTCLPAVATQFDRAVTLLHSFEFGAAIQGFTTVLAVDSTCAMAQWGIALSRWTNPMAAGLRSPAALEGGRRAAATAARLGEHASARERDYIGAVGSLYTDYEHASQAARVAAYARAMAGVAARNPSDTEATIFYAIALVAAAPPSDKSYANQLKAGAILEALWVEQPDHPGIAHYIIHAYDVPALAAQAAAAAERYAEIAPAAAHALHMPSHTFTRLGLWQKSVNTNLRSIDAAARESAVGEQLHASDYAVYAYLQMRQDGAAKKIVDGVPAIAAKLDPQAIASAASASAGVFALAAIPARWALERRSWAEAAALAPRTTTIPYAEAMTHLARALGAAHTRDLSRARASIDSLGAIRARLLAAGESYWAEQVAIESLEAHAAVVMAEGRRDDAQAGMREAVAREDATEKNAITPGPIVPAHELFGDMLMELGKPTDALAEYRKSLANDPNRFQSLIGAMKAADATGDRKAGADYAAQVETLTGSRAFTKR